jgi:hypothetical protein
MSNVSAISWREQLYHGENSYIMASTSYEMIDIDQHGIFNDYSASLLKQQGTVVDAIE